ncbi:probable E3 ubiquitin-protein ligase HERC4 isoform X2 [Chrysoperla carnea]|uniref:probable E3 ubiquitin-protein ligase HERC4 isoform X2 n=1 Tax=Chrysoperla carnea TaxID=189513 RepID=UPI001D0811D3|nr:probable E3 ubiquitin-protein ligase HERC4 isoform X2 [Chrysoperla carnea]
MNYVKIMKDLLNMNADDTYEDKMFCWGSTIHGELGLGGIEEEQILVPRKLPWADSENVMFAACGETHSLLVTVAGKVYSCGNNDFGQLGHEQSRKRPQLVAGLDAYVIKSAACGAVHSMAINEWGQIFSWGSDLYGQLGHGKVADIQSTPKIIRALATLNVVQIKCGLRHSLALTNSGELYTWGANDYGQLGIGRTSAFEKEPQLIKSLAGIPMAFIACGGNHSFAVSRSGAVFGWGRNSFGQLGINDEIDKAYPVQLKTLRNIKVRHICCGEDFSVFLTLDGGVFTCGGNQFGQLGHGGTSNEILPRKVVELMGSTITQVCSGRRHTLALVPSRGRIYSFGVGGAGQLGTRQNQNYATPQLVLGPWVNPSNMSVVKSSEAFIVRSIFAGGDHCFVTVTHPKSGIAPNDYRMFEPHTQILNITFDKLKQCENLSVEATVDQDLLSYLEITFRSLACINASFMLANEEHYCCTSKRHGVNLKAAEDGFAIIARLENNSVKDLIWNCISGDLLDTLVPSPPDVEALRVYLILPLYHEFINPKHHNVLHRRFAQSLLSLTPQAKRVVGLWWSSTSNDYFERLVEIFKGVVLYILRHQNIPKNRTINYDTSLQAVLNVLACLNKLNHSLDGLKVPYTIFHLPEIADFVDVRVDYLNWLADTHNQNLYLCNYPFLFDAQAKTQLLQTDQSLQMQSAMNEAATRAFTTMLFAPQYMGNITQFLILNVSRENIVTDTLHELAKYDSHDLKKPLKVKFHDEEALDAGGVRKEFFMLLLREILDPKYGMFKQYEESRQIWFSEDSFEDDVMYHLIGVLCGLAIYNFTIIDLPFPLALYKKILQEPVGLADLKALSPTLGNSLQSILDYEESDLADVFNLNFEISRDVYGEMRTVELKPGGEQIPLTLENKKEFVDLYVDFVLNKSCHQHFTHFYQGFMKVCGGRVLQLFHSHELMSVVVGNEDYDWDALEENAQYKDGYTASDQPIKWFWEVLRELSLEEKKKFLLFLTGCDRIPIQGMKAIKIVIQPTADDRFLPVAHTCFNLLDLPRYQTKERLRYKLLQAIQQTEGFSLV